MSRKYLIGAALMLSLAGTANATSFVGSQGDIRGAKLESAFLHIRSQMPALQASDAQLAQAILAL